MLRCSGHGYKMGLFSRGPTVGIRGANVWTTLRTARPGAHWGGATVTGAKLFSRSHSIPTDRPQELLASILWTRPSLRPRHCSTSSHVWNVLSLLSTLNTSSKVPLETLHIRLLSLLPSPARVGHLCLKVRNVLFSNCACKALT